VARRAIGLTATVRVRGPDPRGDIAADAAFFDHGRPSSNDDDDDSGSIDGAPVVAISATALKLPRPASRPPGDDPRTTTDERTRFIAPLALFLPFLDDSATTGSSPSSPLVPGAEVHVRPGRENPELGDEPGGWIRARVLAATVPRDASDAVDALASTDGLGAIHSSGWSSGGVFPHSSRKNLGAAVTGLVLLDAPVGSHGGDNSGDGWWMEAPVPNAGDAFVACASPFAALAPSHFSCSIVGGHVSAAWGTKGSNKHTSPPVLLADVRMMPGMEGAPVLDARGGGVIGVLTPPLVRFESGTVSGAGGEPRGSRVGSTRSSRWKTAEAAPLVLTMASIRGALGDLVNGGGDGTKNRGGDGGGNTVTSKQKSSPLQDSSRSVVMIETDRGASWASGVVLNTGVNAGGHEQGRALILTNAHVVHPSAKAAGGDGKGPKVNAIRVRLLGRGDDERGSEEDSRSSWRHATCVYVSRGALDVAVLAVELSPADAERLVPVKCSSSREDFDETSPGAPVAVVGHARIGPNAVHAGHVDGSPAVYPGVMSAIVRRTNRRTNRRTKPGAAARGSKGAHTYRSPAPPPAMYQTTASVHSGASGGAVVCPRHGTFLGLVTSNARLGTDGSVVPNLNFSIPASLLEPLFAAADAKKVKDLSLAFEGCLDDDEELRSIWSLRDPAVSGAGLVSKL
jgi:peroxisomal leader peptide-processing protease